VAVRCGPRIQLQSLIADGQQLLPQRSPTSPHLLALICEWLREWERPAQQDIPSAEIQRQSSGLGCAMSALGGGPPHSATAHGWPSWQQAGGLAAAVDTAPIQTALSAGAAHAAVQKRNRVLLRQARQTSFEQLNRWGCCIHLAQLRCLVCSWLFRSAAARAA